MLFKSIQLFTTKERQIEMAEKQGADNQYKLVFTVFTIHWILHVSGAQYLVPWARG